MLGPLSLLLIAPPAHLPPVPQVLPPNADVSAQKSASQALSLPPVAPPEVLPIGPGSLGVSGASPEFSVPAAAAPAAGQDADAAPSPAQDAPGLQPAANWRRCKLEDFQIYQAIGLEAATGLPDLAGVGLVDQLAASGFQVPPQVAALPLTGSGQSEQILAQWRTAIAAEADTSAAEDLQTRLSQAALDFAKQGEFEAARRVIQHEAVPEAVQTEVLSRVSALEAAFNRQRVAQQVDQIRLANQARSSRQPGTARPSSGRITAVQVGPLSVTQRGLGYVGSLPSLNKDYYRRVLQFPGKLGKNVMMFPLPIPAPITSGVGWRSHPVLGDQRFHSGTDLGAPEGTPILAVADGKVTGADNMGGYGLAVVIEHNNGTLETLYGHMSEILVRPGEWVPQGTIIGRVGSTGLSTGPHLHFEVKQLTSEGWVLVDPGAQLAAAQGQLAQVLQGGSLQLQATQLGQTFVGTGGGAQATAVIPALPEVVVPRVLTPIKITPLAVRGPMAIAAKPSPTP